MVGCQRSGLFFRSSTVVFTLVMVILYWVPTGLCIVLHLYLKQNHSDKTIKNNLSSQIYSMFIFYPNSMLVIWYQILKALQIIFLLRTVGTKVLFLSSFIPILWNLYLAANLYQPFTWKWLASKFSIHYCPYINNHQPKELLIVKQILLVSFERIIIIIIIIIMFISYIAQSSMR